MMANARAWVLVVCAVSAGSAAAAPCYADGDVVTLEGTVSHQAPKQAEAAAKPALVLTLTSSACVLSPAAGQGARQQSNITMVQIIDADPPDNARVQLTGKLVTGNLSAYYAVPTAIWVLKQRVLSGQ